MNCRDLGNSIKNNYPCVWHVFFGADSMGILLSDPEKIADIKRHIKENKDKGHDLDFWFEVKDKPVILPSTIEIIKSNE